MRNRFDIFGTLSDVTDDEWIEGEEELEARLRRRSGANRSWTAIDGSAAFYCGRRAMRRTAVAVRGRVGRD